MTVSDILLFLNENDEVTHLQNLSQVGAYYRLPLNLDYIGRRLDSFVDIDFAKTSGHLNWMGQSFRYVIIANAGGLGRIVHLSTSLIQNKLLETVLDTLSEGLQIYDRNGTLLFCNRMSESIEKTDRTQIVGKHLLEIYHLNESYSTILSTLKTQSPVLNRCDDFRNKDNEMIVTMNSGHPLFLEGELMGAVVVVDDEASMAKKRHEADLFDQFRNRRKKIGSKKETSSSLMHKYYRFEDLIGESTAIQDVISFAKGVALRDSAVLIHGETGTGKELFAQSIHAASQRQHKEFIALNCAAVPETLMEGIFFGTEKGAFTGSVDRVGLFEQAEGGTLFLDEINSMPLHMQSKLLRVIQERKFRRVGGLKDLKCDVRIISSTNEDPFEAISQSHLRKDLYYRLATVTLTLPPLRERLSDVPLLVKHFTTRLCERYQCQKPDIQKEALAMLSQYNWPGNVRELMHAVEYALNTPYAATLGIENFPKYIHQEAPNKCNPILHPEGTLEQQLAFYEKQILKEALANHKGNISQTAKDLGLLRQSLQYRLKKYKLI